METTNLKLSLEFCASLTASAPTSCWVGGCNATLRENSFQAIFVPSTAQHQTNRARKSQILWVH